MSKRGSFDIKKRILELIKSSQMSYAELERKVNTGFNTIKANCEEMEKFGFIEINKLTKHPRSGRPYFQVGITEKGREFLKNYAK